MCFSPQASFAASLFLLIVSVASYFKIKKSHNKAQLFLVVISLVFAIQQFCEGFVWLSLLNNYSDVIRNLSVYSFIFFAFIFWPAYTPICMYKLESSLVRQKILKIFSLLGLTTAAVLLERMIYFGVTAQVASCHIMYNSELSQFGSMITLAVMIAYLLATVGALLVSSFPNIAVLGALIGLSYLATYLFYLNFLISVWCFFAAVISLLIYYIVCPKQV